MKTRTLLCALALSLAACGQSATAPADVAGPRFNGGMTMGGGLVVPPDTTEEGATASTAPTCTEGERGGMTMGGGLYTGPQPCP